MSKSRTRKAKARRKMSRLRRLRLRARLAAPAAATDDGVADAAALEISDEAKDPAQELASPDLLVLSPHDVCRPDAEADVDANSDEPDELDFQDALVLRARDVCRRDDGPEDVDAPPAGPIAAQDHAPDADDPEDDDPPFDPPDENDDIFGVGPFKRGGLPPLDAAAAPHAPTRANEDGLRPRSTLALTRPPRDEARATEQPVPRITIHASCDRADIADLVAGVAADPRMARATITVERGGVEGAIARLAAQESPNLLILDTTLKGPEMLASLDRLAAVIEQGARVLVIGAVNDIVLYRDLLARGVGDYLVPPFERDALVRAVCGLYAAGVERPFAGRVIAVIGARGGVGASTIAHNLAWSIAERQEAGATLVDLDLAFGTAAFNFDQDPPESIADLLAAPDRVDDAALERVTIMQTPRLQILTAPAALESALDLEAQAFDVVLDHVRRTSPFVILDLPHIWNSWVRQTLLTADDVLIVAGPDLASLRNAQSILDVLRSERPEASAPAVALSMVGVPEWPEIPLKDLAEALGAEPVASFAFDPALFGESAINGLMIGEAAPRSKTAVALDALASSLTGRSPVERKKAAVRWFPFEKRAPASAPAPAPEPHQGFKLLDAKCAAEADARASAPPDAATQADAEADAPPSEACDLVEPALMIEAPEEDAPAPILDLAQEAPKPQNEYLVKAREAARARLVAPPETASAPQRTSRVAVAAGLAALLLLGGAWYIQNRREPAPAAEPQHRPVARLAPIRDEPVSAEWRRLAARYEFALDLLQVGRAREAAMLLRRAAERGFPMAQYRLAKLYEHGQGVEADLTLAWQWTERAAAAGNRDAMHDLGVYYAVGDGAPRDEAAAFRWFRQAAELGVVDSQYNLGILYEQGRGVSANPSEALFWFLVAASHGDQAAAAGAAAVETHVSRLHAEQAHARAQAFRPRTASVVANGPFGPLAHSGAFADGGRPAPAG